MIKKLTIKFIIPLLDVLLAPLVFASSGLLKVVRKFGIQRMPLSRAIFNSIGMFPILDHYYEPLFNPAHLRRDLSAVRSLPGMNWNADGQLALLEKFTFNEELKTMPRHKESELGFFYENPSFRAGDAEFLYNMIRLHKPARIIEIGSGFSTLLAHAAIEESRKHHPGYLCEHTCIEPYEMDWLERLEGVNIIRRIVEETDPTLFSALGENDILFIDSSHVIRPQGDVLFEFLEILPALKPGVLIHIHDIYSPRDYPVEWIVGQVKLWNEQYLLEAFLSCNPEFEIIGALNYLKHEQLEKLASKCPVLEENPAAYEPGSFWIRKTR